MKRRLLFLVLSFFLFLNAVPAPKTALRPGKDRAIFFAVEKYQNGKLTNLQNPVKNAREIAAELKKRFGFEIEVLENPTQEQIIGKLNELSRLYARNEDGQHPADGQLLLFFSGHGMSEDENGYFLPADADPAKPYEKGIAYEIWRPKIDKINCRHILVAIDACYSVRFDPDWKNKPDGTFKRPGEMTDAQRALANYETYKARVFFTSDNKEDQTPDRSNFARKLLEGLRSAGVTDGFLTSKQLFANFVEGASPTPRAGTFGSDEPSSAFLFYDQNASPKTGTPPNETPTDLSDWNAAKAANTIEAYEAYLKKHSTGDFAEAAKGKVAAIFDSQLTLIPGGSFQMGSNDGENHEKPVHTVTISDFYMSKYEVTVAEFRTFVEATDYRTDAEKEGTSYAWEIDKLVPKVGQNWRHDPEGSPATDNHPVINVSWNDANEYCKWLSQRSGRIYRLPTEAEWEYAAGNGHRHTKFSWGNELLILNKKVGNVADESICLVNGKALWVGRFIGYNDGYCFTAPIGSFEPNDFGLYDMTGNVWEFCSDWEGPYSSLSATNPTGSPSGSKRVHKGGSYDNDARGSRVTFRGSGVPSDRYNSTGFRLTRSK